MKSLSKNHFTVWLFLFSLVVDSLNFPTEIAKKKRRNISKFPVKDDIKEIRIFYEIYRKNIFAYKTVDES